MLDSPWGTSAMRSAITCQSSAVSRRHQVERHAHGLHRAPEHAQVAQPLAGVVLGERELEPFPHHLGGDAVGVGLQLGGVERAERGPVELGALGGAVGGEVGHLVVVPADALTGGGQRIERGEALDVVVGEVVHGRAHDDALLFSRGS